MTAQMQTFFAMFRSTHENAGGWMEITAPDDLSAREWLAINHVSWQAARADRLFTKDQFSVWRPSYPRGCLLSHTLTADDLDEQKQQQEQAARDRCERIYEQAKARAEQLDAWAAELSE